MGIWEAKAGLPFLLAIRCSDWACTSGKGREKSLQSPWHVSVAPVPTVDRVVLCPSSRIEQ